MADKELDYMDADVFLFLADSGQAPTSSVHPQSGMQSKKKSGQAKARGQLWSGKREAKVVKQKQQEDELRAAGLETAIPTINIGFKLLQQMGYRPGQAIGKEGVGRIEPLGINVKRNRRGLGRDEELREEAQRKAARHQQALDVRHVSQQQLAAEFQERTRGKWEGKRVRRDVDRCRTALAKLEGRDDDLTGSVADDLREKEGYQGAEGHHGKERKPLDVAALRQEGDDTGDVGEAEEDYTVEALHELREHLRNAHHYCIYCGIKYDSKEDLEAECPGEEDDVH